MAIMYVKQVFGHGYSTSDYSECLTKVTRNK